MAVQTASANLTKAEQFVIFSEYEQLGGAELSIQLGRSIVIINEWAEKLGVRKKPTAHTMLPTSIPAESALSPTKPAVPVQAELAVQAHHGVGKEWSTFEVEQLKVLARSCRSVNALVQQCRDLFGPMKSNRLIINEVYWMRRRLIHTNELHVNRNRPNTLWNYTMHTLVAVRAEQGCALQEITDSVNKHFTTSFTPEAVAAQLCWLGYSVVSRKVLFTERRYHFKRDGDSGVSDSAYKFSK